MQQGEDAQLLVELVEVHYSVSQHSSRTSHSGAMKLLELQTQLAEEEAQREMQKIALEVEQQLQQRLRMLDAQQEASSRMAHIKEAMIRESLADDSSSVIGMPTGGYKSQQARNFAKEQVSQSFVEGSTVPKVVTSSTTDSPKQGASIRSTSATSINTMPVTHIADAESLRVGTSSAKQVDYPSFLAFSSRTATHTTDAESSRVRPSQAKQVDHAHSFAFGRQATTHVPDAEPAMVRADLIKQMNLSHTSAPGTKVRFDDTSYASIVSNAPAFKVERYSLLLLVTRPLPRDGGMTENHGAPEAGQLSRVWTRGRKEKESRQRVSGAESAAGQRGMRREIPRYERRKKDPRPRQSQRDKNPKKAVP